MEQIISCCGCVCSECSYYPKQCGGCPAIEGKPFWLQYTGEESCGIYRCCIEEKEYPHCGRCRELPCKRYEQQDPSRTPEENAEGLRCMLEVLRSLD